MVLALKYAALTWDFVTRSTRIVESIQEWLAFLAGGVRQSARSHGGEQMVCCIARARDCKQ
ncbi:hypothetical protein CWO91_00690 [Bradyrhizobium genosp. SA-3]|nr:hypothetical protein CWO91_00690 [Bradyrhizobium genosp. SA-3]